MYTWFLHYILKRKCSLVSPGKIGHHRDCCCSTKKNDILISHVRINC